MQKSLVLVTSYILCIIALIWLLFASVRESFEDIVQRKPFTIDETKCMECMIFYQDVFQFTEASEIVPYVQKRTEYLKYILRELLLFNQTTIDTCLSQYGDGEKTLQQVIGCFGSLIEDLMQKCSEKGMSRSECAVIQKLNDRAFEKALLCGPKECTVSEFRERYKTEVEVLAQNLIACGEAFANNTDACVQMYARIMEAKKAVPSELATPDDAVVTQKELKQKVGEMTAFVMLNG